MPSSLRSEPQSFSGRHLLVTGGTGFLGRSLLDYLIESATLHGPHLRVTVLTRDPRRFLDRFTVYAGRPWLRFVGGDLSALPRLPDRITDVIHAAADTHRVGGNKIDWLDQLVDGTRRVLDHSRNHGVERLLYVSSGAVYGAQQADVGTLAEHCATAPLPNDTAGVYGTGKRMAEHLCALYREQYGLACVIARCFAILSEHIPLDGPFAAGNFIRDALHSDAIAVKGDGASIRTYLDGRDAAHWLASLLLHGSAGEAYNVGSDEPVSVLALAQQIGAQLAPDKPVVVAGHAEARSRSVYVPDILKARSLGLSVETSLTDAIGMAGAKLANAVCDAGISK